MDVARVGGPIPKAQANPQWSSGLEVALVVAIPLLFVCRRGSMVEQDSCKVQVVGSTPIDGST